VPAQLNAAPLPHRVVDAARLVKLNADSAACIARWRIAVAHSEDLGRYLVSGTGVPAGETVMVLPPNLIQAFADVRDYNTVIQVRCGCAAHARPAALTRALPGALQRAPVAAAVQRQPDSRRPGQLPVAQARFLPRSQRQTRRRPRALTRRGKRAAASRCAACRLTTS
jgi:hypothetical protein